MQSNTPYPCDTMKDILISLPLYFEYSTTILLELNMAPLVEIHKTQD